MTCKSLRVLLVEDDPTLAARLTDEILDCGHHVVGPVADRHEAIQISGSVQAAILDVAAQSEPCFWVADALLHRDVPFVFLTDSGASSIPSRFGARRIYSRHRHAAPILDDLHRQRQHMRPEDENDGLDRAVIEMLQRSRQIMPDFPSAERLVEAALQRAVAQPADDALADVEEWLLGLLDQEYLLRGRSHLH